MDFILYALPGEIEEATDIEIADVEVGENEYLYVFTFFILTSYLSFCCLFLCQIEHNHTTQGHRVSSFSIQE